MSARGDSRTPWRAWSRSAAPTGAAGKAATSFTSLDPGTYDVAEAVPAGWTLASATCSDGSPPSAICVPTPAGVYVFGTSYERALRPETLLPIVDKLLAVTLPAQSHTHLSAE